MSISLREITPDNFFQCINLKVADSQVRFVASNLMSMAQAKVYPTANPRAIYVGDEMVGFVMYSFDTTEQRFYLVRVMIDEKHQGRGYGRAAIVQVIEKMKQIPDCREIYLSVVPGNDAAEKLYLDLGFEHTGEINGDGENVMRRRLALR